MESLKIFVWQSSIDYHAFYTWQSLDTLIEQQGSVTFVLGQTENDIRKAQGWNAVDLDKLNVLFLPKEKLWSGGIKFLKENLDAIHVFLAFRGTKKGYDFFPLILYSLRKNIKVAVINEPYSISPVGYYDDDHNLWAHVNVWIRPFLYRTMALLINSFSKSERPCILPISLIAKEQFRRSGFDPESMFPFGWFVPDLNRHHTIAQRNIALRIIYVGTMNKRKGVDILIAAMKVLRSQGYDVILDLYGSEAKMKYENCGSWLSHKGLLPFEDVQSVIEKHDVLVIPSRHDGWGVVVNEALLQGVPVIASNRVGAKQLVEASGAGLIFESENVNDLAEKIKMVVDNPVLLDELKKKALLVKQLIFPEKGAQYFLDVLRYHFHKIGSHPHAIWSGELCLEEHDKSISNCYGAHYGK